VTVDLTGGSIEDPAPFRHRRSVRCHARLVRASDRSTTGAAQGDPTPGTSVASVVGDRDGFGYGLPPGATRPGDLFNNRQLGDPDFTDVYPVPATYSPRLAVFS
jgi:hypothetical protein